MDLFQIHYKSRSWGKKQQHIYDLYQASPDIIRNFL